MKHYDLDDARINVTDVPAAEVLRNIATSGKQDEAFFVLDISDVVRKHEAWSAKLPRVDPFFAIKCNNSRPVVSTLWNLGCGFDVASQAEIQQLMTLGVDPERLVFANTVKQAWHIQYAKQCRVDLLAFDNEVELRKIRQHFPSARLLLRVRSADTTQSRWGCKFGAEESQAKTLLKQAIELGLNVVGTTFYAGDNSWADPDIFRRAIVTSRALFDLAKQQGVKFTLLDIGGGMPGHVAEVGLWAGVINEALDHYFPASSGVRVIAEPGQYFTRSAGTLATRVYAKRKDPQHGTMYYINDGTYGTFNARHYYLQMSPPVPLIKVKNATHTEATLWGPTCDSEDQVTGPVLLPELDDGDWLTFANMGAYVPQCANEFNGFPKPKTYYICNKATWSKLKDRMSKDMFNLE